MRIIDIPVNIRLAVAVLVPISILMFLGISKVSNSYGVYKDMSKLVSVTAQIKTASDLVHALQVERGTTAGFIGSKGKKLATEVSNARKNVDKALVEFHKLENQIIDSGNAQFIAIVDEIERGLGKLDEMRSAISRLKVAGAASFNYYNSVIASLTSLVNHEILDGKEKDITTDLIAYSELMAAKELAGQERGIGAGVISAGKFDEARFAIFLSKGGAQAALLDRYLALQPDERAELYKTRFQESGTEDLDRLRQSMLRYGMDSDLSKLDPKVWFEQATKRIVVMKELEDENIGKIRTHARNLSEEKWAEFIALLIFVTAAFALAAYVAMSLAKTVTKPLTLLCQCMNELVQGNTNAHMIHSEGKDEIGQMGSAVKAYIAKSKNDLEQQAKEQAERESLKEREQLAIDKERADKSAEIEHAMTEIGKGLKLLASGDISHQIPEPFADALDPLRQDYNETAKQLSRTISNVKNVVDAMTSGIEDLEQASESLSIRTDEQAFALENTTNALNEVSRTVQDTSKSAEKAGTLVDKASGFAAQSSVVVDNTVTAISKVEHSSSQISDIIVVIDEIAFQTNLLALNAGVEAARAGEAGSGFAVVAEEVRDLAQRSATAAREIKELIDRSAVEVNSGVDLVNETGTALKNISEQVGIVNGEVVEIVASSRLQSTAITEINESIMKLEQVTKDNTSMVASNKNLTAGLVESAKQLTEQVDYFSVENATPQQKVA